MNWGNLEFTGGSQVLEMSHDTKYRPPQDHLWFLENLDRVNRAIQESNDLDQMMTNVLDVVLEIFDCDRVWLVYPCDPSAQFWQIPMERTKAQYPGAGSQDHKIAMDPVTADVFARHLAAHAPLKYGADGFELPAGIVPEFGVRSFLSLALHPRGDKPWMFGMHQCSHARAWTRAEERLFQEISRRLTDGLTSLIAYRNLMKSEDRYRRIVETASEGILMVDADTSTIFANAKMARMLGYNVEELVGKRVEDLFFDDELMDHQSRMQDRRFGATQTYERSFRHKSGKRVWTLISGTPTYDDKLRFSGSLGMVTDITERKRMEEDLVRAKEEAEKAAQSKARFLDIAAHELRTPVTSLALSLSLAQKLRQQGQSFEASFMDRLERQTNRLCRLVIELLDASRLDRGEFTLNRTMTDLVALLKESIEEFSIRSPERKIDLHSSDAAAFSNIDALRIQQVISNLLDNAIKYTPTDSPLEARIESTETLLRVSITDHGQGISEEQQKLLFKPFVRGQSELTERASGLGLGLTICEGIVKLHGGSIGVKSEIGSGSTFYFDLPLN